MRLQLALLIQAISVESRTVPAVSSSSVRRGAHPGIASHREDNSYHAEVDRFWRQVYQSSGVLRVVTRPSASVSWIWPPLSPDAHLRPAPETTWIETLPSELTPDGYVEPEVVVVEQADRTRHQADGYFLVEGEADSLYLPFSMIAILFPGQNVTVSG